VIVNETRELTEAFVIGQQVLDHPMPLRLQSSPDHPEGRHFPLNQNHARLILAYVVIAVGCICTKYQKYWMPNIHENAVRGITNSHHYPIYFPLTHPG
jgi:hypothetical protein